MKAGVIFFLILFTHGNEASIEPMCDKASQCRTVCVAQQCTVNGDHNSCTQNRKGAMLYDAELKDLQMCDGKTWETITPWMSTLRGGLVGHWPMDEETGTNVVDYSGFENHASASRTTVSPSRYGRGRYFDSSGVITVPNSVSINLGTSSFTMAGWVKILDTTYPLTTFSVRKGFGCYFGDGRQGWLPGWEIAHGYNGDGTRVCIRDHLNYRVNTVLKHDAVSKPSTLVGKWVHYAFVFDRMDGKIYCYVNGKLQQQLVDISTLKGSVDNSKPLEFGEQYGWKTRGTLDEYRLYNRALLAREAKQLYEGYGI